MKSISLLLTVAAMAVIWTPPMAVAQTVTPELSSAEAPQTGAEKPTEEAVPSDPVAIPEPPGPFLASEISFDAQRYTTRPLILFADSPDDLNYTRQLSLVQAGLDDLALRDVVVVLDTNPAEMSEWRRHLRPRGFSLVQLDKDFAPVFRKPLPWSIREIARSIDKLESRRQELAERFPGR